MSGFIRPWDINQQAEEQENKKSSRSLMDNLGDLFTAASANFDDVRGSERLGDLRNELMNSQNMSDDQFNQKRAEYVQELLNREDARKRYAQAHQNLVDDDSFFKNIDQFGGTAEGMLAQGIGTVGGAALGAIASPFTAGGSIAMGAKIGNAAGAVAGGYLDANSVALQAEEDVLNQGGTWEQAKEAYYETLKKASLTTLPETLADIVVGNRLVRAGLNSGVARKIAGSTLGRAGSAVLDPAARLGTKAAFASGKSLVGRGVGLATDVAMQGLTEAGQEVTQDYIANREVAKAMGQADNEYSLGGFKDYALSPEGLETMKTAGIMGALFGGAGGAISSGQYLQRGAETNRGIQTRNVVNKMIQDGSIKMEEDQRERLEKFISEEKGNNLAELASWSDSEIIAEASIIEGRKYALENKTGEKENLSTIRGAVNIINRITGNESTNITVDDLTPQAKEYLDTIGVADDMRQQMFKPTSKALVVAKLSGNTINSMKQNEGKTIQEVMQDEKIKQIPHRSVPLLQRPQPNFTMGEGTAARYTGNPNFIMYNNETSGINTDNLQTMTNREVIDLARQTQNDSPYSSTRQAISEEMTRRGLNLGDENREVGQYTGEPYSGSRDISTMIDGKVMNDTTADIFANKLLETYGDNVNAIKELLRKFYKQAKNDQERVWITKIGHIAGQRYQAMKNGTAYNENGTYYAGQEQPNNNFGYAGTVQDQSTDIVPYNGGGGTRFTNNNELRANPLPLNARQFNNGNGLGETVAGTSFVQNLTTPTESGTVEKNEGGQINGQTEDARRGEDLRGINQQQIPDRGGIRQEPVQSREHEENVGRPQEGVGNSQEGILSNQKKEETFGRQILGRIPKALKAAWKGLGCNSKIEDWRVVSGKKEYLQLFSDALSNAIRNNKTHGVYVDAMSVEDLEGATVILHKSKKAGLAIDKNGTLHGVFKDPSLNIPYIIHDITLIAREMGCVRMDCFGEFLADGYQTLGFTPVARLNFNEAFYPADNPANVTIREERPSVYVLVRNEDNNEVSRNNIANGGYKFLSTEELERLPLFENYIAEPGVKQAKERAERLGYDDYSLAIKFGDIMKATREKLGEKANIDDVFEGFGDAIRIVFDNNGFQNNNYNDSRVLKGIIDKLKAKTNSSTNPVNYTLFNTLIGELQNIEGKKTNLSKKETQEKIDKVLKIVDRTVSADHDQEATKTATAWAVYRNNQDAKVRAQQKEKQNAPQQKTKETIETPISQMDELGKGSGFRELGEEESTKLEQKMEEEVAPDYNFERGNNKPSSEQATLHYFKNKKEGVEYFHRKLKEKMPQGEQKKQTTQQKPTKQKTESDNIVDKWIEKFTEDGEFNLNDALTSLFEQLDKGNITQKEYDQISNAIMEYAENQEEESSQEQKTQETKKESSDKHLSTFAEEVERQNVTLPQRQYDTQKSNEEEQKDETEQTSGETWNEYSQRKEKEDYEYFLQEIRNGEYHSKEEAYELIDKTSIASKDLKNKLKEEADKYFAERDNRIEHYWDKYRSKDGIIENEKEGVYQEGNVDEPLFADWKDEDEIPSDGQDYIYILCGNYDVSNKILANLKAKIKKEMNSKNPRGDMDFFNDAYEEISSEQESRAENDERISADENTCPWTSEMIFDNMLEQAQFIENQNEEESGSVFEKTNDVSNVIREEKQLEKEANEKLKGTKQKGLINRVKQAIKETFGFGRREGDIIERYSEKESRTSKEGNVSDSMRGGAGYNRTIHKGKGRRAKTIGFSLTRRLIKNGFVDLTGQKINSVEELAEIAQVLRHPGYEKFHCVYVKNGEIVYHETVSTMLPGSSSLWLDDENSWNDYSKRVSKHLKDTKADSVYILHNHPSGSIEASQADIDVTREHRLLCLKEKKNFGGHIILDTTKCSILDNKGNITEHEIPKNVQINYSEKQDVPHILLGEDISGQIYKLSKRLADQSTTTAFFVDSQYKIRGIVQLPTEFSKLKPDRMNRYLRWLARQNYSRFAFISTGDANAYRSMWSLFQQNHSVLDIVYTKNPTSAQGMLKYPFARAYFLDKNKNNFFGINGDTKKGKIVLGKNTNNQNKTETNNKQGKVFEKTKKPLTDEQIEAMDKREEKEYNKRQERIQKADEAGELSDVVKDVYSVTFTESAQEFAENRTRMEYFDNRDKYWDRSEKNGNVTYTRKTPFEHHQNVITYNGANELTKEQKKKSKPAQWAEWVKDQVIKYAFNDMHFLAKAARKLGKYDSYVKMIVTKGYALKANTAMQRGIKYNGKYTRALNDIIKEIGDEKQKDFIEYCIAKRVVDLSNRDVPVYQDMKPDEAKDLIKKYESGADAKLFMKNQKDFVQYNHALLHILVDAGIHTEEEFQNLIKVDPNFVPLTKVMDDADMGFNSIQAARSIVNVKTPLKRIGTSLRKVKNPFLEMQKRTAEYYAIASRNKAGQIFVNEIADALDKSFGGNATAKGQGMIRKVQVDEKDGNLITKPDDKQQIIYVCNDGKHEFYQVSDPEIYRALKALDADQMGTIQKMIDPFLHAPSALIRETATMVPDFGVRNLLRDGGEAFLTSEHGFLPFIDQIWGMYQMANNTEWYQRFLEQQGEYGTYNRDNANDGVARVEDTIDEKVNPIKNFNEIRKAAFEKFTNKKNSKTTRAVALLQLMGSMPYAVMKSNKRINDYLEMGTRVGEFKNAKMGYEGTLDRLSRGGILDWSPDIKKERQDDLLAAGAAKEITLNFGQHGIVGKQLNRYVPFFNATLQGIYKMCNALELMATGTTISGEKNRKLQSELLFKAALITAIGIGVAAAGEGDDDYEEANQYEKENFWILPNGLRFPKDQVLGKLFGNVAEKSYTQWKKGKFEPSDILRSVLENFTPDKFIPALAEIALGGMYNYDTFYKSAIVPEYMQGKLGHLQKDLATSNMAADVSDFLWKYTKTDVSAKRLDWALQKNLTNCKKYIDAVYDLCKKTYDPKSFNEKMARGYDKSDSTGAFVGGLKDDIPKPLSLVTGTFATNRTNYKSISDFYEKYNDLKKLATDETNMSKEEKRQWKRYEQAYKKDKNFRKQLRAIKGDSSLTGKEKREKADKIFKQQIKLAKWAEG